MLASLSKVFPVVALLGILLTPLRSDPEFPSQELRPPEIRQLDLQSAPPGDRPPSGPSREPAAPAAPFRIAKGGQAVPLCAAPRLPAGGAAPAVSPSGRAPPQLRLTPRWSGSTH